MNKAKIIPGDWYTYPESMLEYKCFMIGEHPQYSDAFLKKHCTKLPAPPKDLIRCWKLAEKAGRMMGTNDRDECLSDLFYHVTKSKSAKQARGKRYER